MKMVLVFIIVILLGAPSLSHGLTTDRVLATVNDEVITFSDYRLFVKSTGIIESRGDVDEGLLKKLIEEKVILHEAKRKGVEISDMEADNLAEDFKKDSSLSQEDFEKELAKEGVSIQGYRKLMKDKLMAMKLVETEVDSKVMITDREVEDFYNAHKRDYLSSPGRVEVKAIFLKLNEGATVTEITDLKRKALKIAAQLKEIDSFELLVDQYDDEYLKSKEGRLGEFEKGQLIPQLDKKVFSMRDGEISEPIWVKEGVYILKLTNKTGEVFKPIGEVREDVYRDLYKQKREVLFNEWMKTLWEKASIKIN